mgnify:CR=1 FL=1
MRLSTILLAALLLPPRALCADPPTPASVVESLRALYDALSDYQCRMYEHCSQDGRYEERTIDFYFKKPRLIRMNVLKGNRFGDNGAVGVYRNDGKVTGRKGGLLSFLTIVVDKHDAQATTVRGLTFDQSDLQATLEKMELHLSVSRCSIVDGAGFYELEFEPRDPSRLGGLTREIIRLDESSLLPISSDSFEGETLVQHAVWSSYILDAGLPDELFDVRWDPGRLAVLGIRSVHEVPLR